MSVISESLTLSLVIPLNFSCNPPGTIFEDEKLTPLSILASVT